MNIDQIIADTVRQIIREELTVEIYKDYGFYSHNSYEVRLLLNGEQVSRSSVEITQ
jgi:hypothetical protein